MVSRSGEACQIPRWKRELAEAFTSADELLRFLDLPISLADEGAGEQFRLLVPRGFAERMRPTDAGDPLLRQVLTTADEQIELPGFVADPVDDAAAVRAPGLLQKYRGRALLVVTGACAVHCRYCFRRHYPYAGASTLHDRSQAALAAIAADPGIDEVILSGGDPLTLDDRLLADLVAAIADIPQVRRLRVHSRLPIVLPSRISDTLVALLTGSRLRCVMVVHANHAQELDQSVAAAAARMTQGGMTLLNQSVLLAGVNDDAGALGRLSEALFDMGVLPYYLHQLDPVRGAAHFQVDDRRAMALIEAVRERLPGYLVPKLVRELPGAPSKTPVR